MRNKRQYTAEVRQRIIEDYCRRNGGWDAAGFFEEVRATGESHEAYDYFNWNKDAAAYEHNVWQARVFSQGLKINFTIEEVGRSGPIKITRSAPLVHSPLAGRSAGGGYDLTDPSDLSPLCQEAAMSLRSWLNCYGACLSEIDTSTKVFERVIELLKSVRPKKKRA